MLWQATDLYFAETQSQTVRSLCIPARQLPLLFPKSEHDMSVSVPRSTLPRRALFCFTIHPLVLLTQVLRRRRAGSTVGTFLTVANPSTDSWTCPHATLSTANLKLTDLGSNPSLSSGTGDQSPETVPTANRPQCFCNMKVRLLALIGQTIAACFKN
jgi:hypothetical protein